MAAVLCSLPHWAALWRNGGDYTPFSVSPAVSAIVFDETHAYAPPARRFFIEGHVPAEVDNFENRARTAAVPLIPPVILGSMARVLGSLERSFVAADCIFPALLFLLLFALARGIPFRWRLLVVWSTLIIPFGVLNSFWLGDDARIAPLELTRTPQPEISFLVLLIAAALFARSLRSGAHASWTLAAGVASGAVVYCYYFYTVAWGAALFLAICFGLLWRWRNLWTRALFTLAIMAALAIPYALAGLHSAGQTDLLSRVGVFTRQPHLIAAAVALLFALAIWRFGRRSPEPILMVLVFLVLGALAGMNVHILSGYETQPWHFWKRLALPVAFFIAVFLIARFINEHVPRAATLASVLLILLLANTAARLCVAGILTAPYQRASNPQITLLHWIDRELPHHSVIGTIDPELILLLPALTTDYTYVPSGIRSLTPTTEIINRYYQLACLLGFTPSELENEAARPSHLRHSTEVLHALGLSTTGDPAMFHQLVGEYRDVYARCTKPTARLDYLIVSSPAEEQSVARRLPGAQEIYHNAQFRVLKLAHPIN